MDDPGSSKPFCWRLLSLWSVCGIAQHLAFVPPDALFFHTPVVPPSFLAIAHALALAVG